MTTDELIHKIIGAALEVHHILGPGLLESIYEEALSYELTLRSINFQRQREIEMHYKGITNKGQRIDLLVENQVVLELKSLQFIPDVAFAQVLSYLKALNLKRGLLINFGEKKLVNGIKRISN